MFVEYIYAGFRNDNKDNIFCNFMLTLLISAILLGATFSQASASDIQKRSIRYIERIRNYASSFNNQGIPLKTDRLSNNGGNIVLTYDESLPDSIQTSILVAKELWESKLSAGWDLPMSGLSIKCDNISNNGIGSSYEPHTFSLLKGDKNISNYSWRFLLKDKQGNYTRISDGTGESFTIAEISSPDNYFVNVNGDLEGRIECDYTLDGKRYSAIPFTLSLELEPIIFSIDDLTVVDNGEYEFYLTFNVRYTGADYVSVEVEEEYNTTLRRYRFDEPYIAHVKTGNITNLYYSWVTVIVSNKYDTASETMEFAPVSGETDPDISLDIPDSHIVKIILYTMDGTPVFSGTPSEFENQTFKRGIYIKEIILDNGESRTSKVLFK